MYKKMLALLAAAVLTIVVCAGQFSGAAQAVLYQINDNGSSKVGGACV